MMPCLWLRWHKLSGSAKSSNHDNNHTNHINVDANIHKYNFDDHHYFHVCHHHNYPKNFPIPLVLLLDSRARNPAQTWT